ncbi:HI0074 family nucleotidyltransferase substrate-binding subunit [Methylohalobius crimeensis]|uniref:HI0074 family nucleotidyltransferase substrate-binding subunit n=1 Tax=Methylohalobius crimeensis TaxID=244365 RepID=UPI0003B55431|nr:HI0074 family nucleotidyltransferase substrate-binding subunit [Methylohalobius crimeensis]
MQPDKILEDFESALAQLEAALQEPADSDLIKAGCIQYFEFCFELAWKTVKIVAADLGLECRSPKACLKTAFQQEWIDEGGHLLAMLAARNRMSHTYDAQNALSVYSRLPEFLPPMKRLLWNLKSVGQQR